MMESILMEREERLRKEVLDHHASNFIQQQSNIEQAFTAFSEILIDKVSKIQEETVNQFKITREHLARFEARLDTLESESKTIKKDLRTEIAARQESLAELRQGSGAGSTALQRNFEPRLDLIQSELETVRKGFADIQVQTSIQANKTAAFIENSEKQSRQLIETVETALVSAQKVGVESAQLAAEEARRAREMSLNNQMRIEEMKGQLASHSTRIADAEGAAGQVDDILIQWKQEVETAVGMMHEETSLRHAEFNTKFEEVMGLMKTTIAHVRYVQKAQEKDTFASPVVPNGVAYGTGVVTNAGGLASLGAGVSGAVQHYTGAVGPSTHTVSPHAPPQTTLAPPTVHQYQTEAFAPQHPPHGSWMSSAAQPMPAHSQTQHQVHFHTATAGVSRSPDKLQSLLSMGVARP